MLSRFLRRHSGQALAEFALVFPLFALAMFSVIVYGLSLFYQQQLTNAAREAARYAAVHSVEHPSCPTVSQLEPHGPPPLTYYRCDTPADKWPFMTGRARDATTGISKALMHITACWSSYRGDDLPTDPEYARYDLAPHEPDGTANYFVPCDYARMESNPSALPCPTTAPPTDTGSSAASNQVTVYACFNWTPPMAGFLMIPKEWTMRAVVTEVIHHQQS